MTIRARSTYDVWCDGGTTRCMAGLLDLDDTVVEPIEAGWTVYSATHLDQYRFVGAEVHLCPTCAQAEVAALP